MTTVHKTAIVSPEAQIATGVEIGPYAIIGPYVRIGKGTRILPHVVIDGHTSLGERNVVFPGSCLGMPPQDKKFREAISYLRVGDDNVIREHVTMHAGGKPGSVTTVGSRNYLMVGMHVGHDSTVGDDVTIANGSALGGYAVVEDKAMIGGVCGVHQFCRVGKLAMVGAVTKVTADVAPFSVCEGRPARFYGLNSVGLKRAGYSSKAAQELKRALKILFASGLNFSNAADRVRREFGGNADVAYLLAFAEASKRGITRAGGGAREE